MSEQGEKPEVLPGDLITGPGLYETRCGEIVPITDWEDNWWIAEWDGGREWYASDGRRRFYEGPDADPWQLLHWVGPLPATEPEPETTTEQLADTSGRDIVRGLVLQVADLIEREQPEPQPEPQPVPQRESDAELRVKLLKHANDTQAETIGRLMTEARDLNMEIGGLERQLLQRDARIRDLETMHAAAAQAVVGAGKQNDALRVQVRILQQEADKKNSRIEFLETLDAGNAVAICDYKAKVEKLQGLLDFARKQLEDAANEISQQRSHLDAHDKQLDQKDAQIRDLRIELDAAQQVQQPVGDEERERIWDEAAEAAGRQVIGWLRPMIAALNKQPNERFQRFMALTLSVLPDLLPEVLGYAVEDETDGDCKE